MAAVECASLEEVRARIDGVDRETARLPAERGAYVGQAVRFKGTADEARAPARVEQAIANVRRLGLMYGADRPEGA